MLVASWDTATLFVIASCRLENVVVMKADVKFGMSGK